MSITCKTYGGIVAALRVPDRVGHLDNVVLGLPRLEDYVTHSPYFGALIGRYGNRIAGGRFRLDGVDYRLNANDGPNSLHGGRAGFDRQVWSAEAIPSQQGLAVALTRQSPEGEEGYPGTLDVRVTYTLTETDEFRIDYEARTDRLTVLNLTSHGYFNLAGEGRGSIEGHELRLNARAYTPVDATLIPTGALDPVAGTPFDFTRPTPIGARLREGHPQLLAARGYDHNWVLDKAPGEFGLAARLRDPLSGRVMEIHTDQPGLQFYSGNFLDGTLVGSSARPYRQGDGLCLETQHFPNSPNLLAFPSTVLRPGEVFRSATLHRFLAE
ncbi:aldose epimerase family protein [Paracraurococcus lichenis]|uniref:Aldose 1-epimerase n=1 Tax=Paracraurococcus lichenis TaxID=3064888 RepID=A0ABT9E950_9PROT|nr:aldose epimerase family protein [Paracraurococcus sp. LOR1-02]MDO9712699.1 aldose epimerase family protein [Paracraurococcus sp. LOR1-02]